MTTPRDVTLSEVEASLKKATAALRERTSRLC